MSVEQILKLEEDYFISLGENIPDLALPSRARAFACWAHGDQKYGSHLPYVYHLDRVAEVLIRFGWIDFSILSAAYLHDVVEDTEIPIIDVKEVFGEDVALLVNAVSEPKGMNRKARHAHTYPIIQNTPRAILLKLADRIANIEESIKSRSSLLQMYRREYSGFRDALRNETDSKAIEMWDCLDLLMKEN